jgi:hypothetical protein
LYPRLVHLICIHLDSRVIVSHHVNVSVVRSDQRRDGSFF